MTERDNVVSLSDRIKALKTKMADDQVKMNDYQPTDQDVHTFLMVLRHLQKQSHNQTTEIECGAEFLTVKLVESVSDELTNRAMFFDVKQKARIITFDFPWHVLDLDRSELTKEDNGKDAVDLFSGAVHRWLNDIKINH